jgi:hypothetical protein
MSEKIYWTIRDLSGRYHWGGNKFRDIPFYYASENKVTSAHINFIRDEARWKPGSKIPTTVIEEVRLSETIVQSREIVPQEDKRTATMIAFCQRHNQSPDLIKACTRMLKQPDWADYILFINFETEIEPSEEDVIAIFEKVGLDPSRYFLSAASNMFFDEIKIFLKSERDLMAFKIAHSDIGSIYRLDDLIPTSS